MGHCKEENSWVTKDVLAPCRSCLVKRKMIRLENQGCPLSCVAICLPMLSTAAPSFLIPGAAGKNLIEQHVNHGCSIKSISESPEVLSSAAFSVSTSACTIVSAIVSASHFLVPSFSLLHTFLHTPEGLSLNPGLRFDRDGPPMHKC